MKTISHRKVVGLTGLLLALGSYMQHVRSGESGLLRSQELTEVKRSTKYPQFK